MLYLKTIHIENTGPFDCLKIDLPFKENGQPQPIALVGKNGSGKTIILSTIADAIIEFGKTRYTDVLPWEGDPAVYFKVGSYSNQKVGTGYGFSFLTFKAKGDRELQYIDKTGTLTYDECKAKTGSLLNIPNRSLTKWQDRGHLKRISHYTEDLLEDTLREDSFCFFPQNRYEKPHWINTYNASALKKFEVRKNINNLLGKPIYITESADENIHWMLNINCDYKWTSGKDEFTNQLYEKTMQLLKLVMDDDELDFMMATRHNPNVLSLGRVTKGQSHGEIELPSLKNLSGGQASLLNLFLTILRYSDSQTKFDVRGIKGIVLIDEVDLFLHFKLKNKILPQLIKEFPNIQFIFSTHSPLVLTGMKTLFGDDFNIIELPSGNETTVEKFQEFEDAYHLYVEENERFKAVYEKLKSKVSKLEKPLVITEGKTDWKHMKAALENLQGEGKFPSLDFEFLEYETEIEMGDTELEKSLKGLAKVDHGKKIIGIFDRDNPKIVKKHDNESGYLDYGNNVFSLCIPRPQGRHQYENISIELLLFRRGT